MKRKQSFILLEILIAISIISMLASFLIYRPFRELKKELEMILAIEEARMWEGEIVKLEALLRSQCTELPQVRAGQKEQEVAFTVSLGDIEKKCQRPYKAWVDYRKDNKNSSEHYLIHVVMKKGKRFPAKPDYKFHHTINPPGALPIEGSKPD